MRIGKRKNERDRRASEERLENSKEARRQGATRTNLDEAGLAVQRHLDVFNGSKSSKLVDHVILGSFFVEVANENDPTLNS